MKARKIRGHKRIWKDIEVWKNNNLLLDIENLQSRERDYAKIWVHPFSSIPIGNSFVPEPKGETRKRILSALFDIYDSWKKQLDELGEPYYLKIWLYEPRVSKSQVVCAIGSALNFYDNTFYKPTTTKEVNSQQYGTLQKRVATYKWDYALDEDFLDNTEVGEPEDFINEQAYEENKKWVASMLTKPHRKIVYKEPIGDVTESYGFTMGTVWLGQQ